MIYFLINSQNKRYEEIEDKYFTVGRHRFMNNFFFLNFCLNFANYNSENLSNFIKICNNKNHKNPKRDNTFEF